MSYALRDKPAVITSSIYSFIAESSPSTRNPEINSETSSSLRMKKKKIALSILDNFVPNPETVQSVISFSYAKKLDSNLENYIALINKTFSGSPLSAKIFSDREAKYESLFITIHSKFVAKTSNKKYMKLLKDVSKSNYYSEYIDIDYSSS